MFDYEWATVQHNVNCRLARAVVVPDAIPPQRLDRYGARGKLRALRGPQGGVLPGRLRARPTAVLRRARARPRARRSWSCARRPRSRSTTASRTTCSRSVLERLRAARPRRRAAGRAAARRLPARASCARVPGFVVPEHAIDAQSLIAHADLVISAGGTMNREAVALGHARLHDLPGPPGRGRRAADRRRAAAHARRAPRSSSCGKRARRRRAAAGAPRPARARRAAALGCVRLQPRAARCATQQSWLAPYNLHNAPTDPLGGPSPPPSLAAAARGGRGAGRARVLPRLPAALRQRPAGPATRTCASDTIWWVLGGQPAGAGALARLPAPLALRRPARLRGGRAGGGA